MRRYTLSRIERKTIATEGAGLMVYRDFTLWEISDYIHYPMSTVYKVMMDELPQLSPSLYEQVRQRMEEHKRRTKRRSDHGILPVQRL